MTNELIIWNKAHVRHPAYGERVLVILSDGSMEFASMEQEASRDEPPEDIWFDDLGQRLHPKWWASVEGPV
jgi:hypothetical protein